MAVPTLQTRISLSQLQCITQQEVFDDEPYLWTAFFKLDGDTAVLDLIGDGPDDQLDANSCFIRGTFTVRFSPGSQDNLGTDMESGDVVVVPDALGTSSFTLKPIPVTPRAKAKLPGNPDFVDGAVGFVAAVLEEDRTSHSVAEIGHKAFNRALKDGLNNLIYQDGSPTGPDDLKDKLGFKNRDTHPTDEQIAAIKEQVQNAATDAIEDATDVILDNDDFLGATHRFVTTGRLVSGGAQEISEVLVKFKNGQIESN
jgi:hypothetical protein